MDYGFTGTQHGMSAAQLDALHTYMLTLPKDAILHHGDCIGADTEAHTIAVGCGHTIVIHPPTNSTKRAFCSGEMKVARDYITRNHDIVDACQVLVAAPLTDHEVLRSGTWATIRYARKHGKTVILLRRW